MAHCLAPVSSLALVGVGLVDAGEVRAQPNLACAHLRNDRADRSVCASMYGEYVFSWLSPKFEALPAMFGLFPGLVLFLSHWLPDGGFRCCHESSEWF